MADDAHRQAADELRLEAELDEVGCPRVFENPFALHLFLCPGGEPDGGLLQSTADDFVEMGKRPADDEEDMACVDGVALFFAAAHALHHCLDLAGHIVLRPRRHLGFLHQLEQGGLYPLAAHVAAALLLRG